MRLLSIVDLPTEIQHGIYSLLTQREVISLSMVCWGLRATAQAFAYSSIEFTWDAKNLHPSIALLLRSLLERPDLGNFIETLALQGASFRDGRNIPRPRSLPGTADILHTCRYKEIIRASSGLSPDIGDIWLQELRDYKPDAIVSLVVSMLPRLRTLSLSETWTEQIRFLGIVFRASLQLGPQMPSFERLERVTLAPRRFQSEYCKATNTRDALTPFYFPGIKELSTSIDNPINFTWPLPTAPQPLLMTSLSLFRIRENRLDMLAPLSNLRHLFYDLVYEADVDPDVSDDTFQLNVLAAAICNLGRLTSLEIRLTTIPAYRRGDHEPPSIRLIGSLSALSGMPSLMQLNVPWVFVAGLGDNPAIGCISAVLPPAIEHVILNDDMADADIYIPYLPYEDTILPLLQSELERGMMASLVRLKSIDLPSCMSPDQSAEMYRPLVEPLTSKFKLAIGFGGTEQD